MVFEIYHIMFETDNRMSRRDQAARVTGFGCCSLFDERLTDGLGEPVFGENHAGISTVMGMVGNGIIARTRHRAFEELGG
jgi:hypothetical protein